MARDKHMTSFGTLEELKHTDGSEGNGFVAPKWRERKKGKETSDMPVSVRNSVHLGYVGWLMLAG